MCLLLKRLAMQYALIHDTMIAVGISGICRSAEFNHSVVTQCRKILLNRYSKLWNLKILKRQVSEGFSGHLTYISNCNEVKKCS